MRELFLWAKGSSFSEEISEIEERLRWRGKGERELAIEGEEKKIVDLGFWFSFSGSKMERI